MGMLLIEGTFRIVGASPDGDSVRFYPDDPQQWGLVGGTHQVRRNASGGAQLQLDGIDSLETHYSVKSGVMHQPLALAHEAAGELMTLLGFSNVVRDASEKVTSAEPDQVPGYVLTRGADIYGRCVALAGAGAAPGASGTQIFVNLAILHETVNYQMLNGGYAYPTYYRKLFPDLRNEMTSAVAHARTAAQLWQTDNTESGAHIASLQALENDVVILPKLFRRLVGYFELNNGDPSLTGFSAYLAQRDDRLFILSTGHSTALDFVVTVDNQTVTLTRPPEDLVFDER